MPDERRCQGKMAIHRGPACDKIGVSEVGMFFYLHPILIIAAIAPAIWLLRFIYRSDRLEQESHSLILSLVLLGILSTLAASILEGVGIAVLSMLLDPEGLAYSVILFFIVVGGSEEGAKYVLLKKRTWNNPEFNCQFDGVVYAVSVSLGFALWENIRYVMQFGWNAALIRAVTAVPGHACFGVLMGAWYGMAKKYSGYGDEGKSALYRKLAFFMPAALHGLYDILASLESESLGLIFVGFVLVMFAFCRKLVKTLSENDTYINNQNDFFYK